MVLRIEWPARLEVPLTSFALSLVRFNAKLMPVSNIASFVRRCCIDEARSCSSTTVCSAANKAIGHHLS